MATFEASRTFDADEATIREAIGDVEDFLLAAGFDDVTVDGDDVTIVNSVGLGTITLECRLLDEPGAVLAYELTEGFFDEMLTTYHLESVDGGTEVTVQTDYALGAGMVGGMLDNTVIQRFRRREIESQFDYLEELDAAG